MTCRFVSHLFKLLCQRLNLSITFADGTARLVPHLLVLFFGFFDDGISLLDCFSQFR